MELNLGPTDRIMKEITPTDKKMDRANWLSVMAAITKVISDKMRFLVWENTTGQKVRNTRDIGATTKCTGKAPSSGKTRESIKVNL